MRYALTIVMIVMWEGWVPYGMAQDTKIAQLPESKANIVEKTAVKVNLPAEIHRNMAALIEARAAEKPDQAKIDELTQKLQQLRQQLRAQNAAEGGCPWGGPGLGYGRGAGWGGGRGAGFGPGGGRGWGGGAGRGFGFGPGGGQGRGPGGAAFVDQDKDGICDYYELQHGMHK